MVTKTLTITKEAYDMLKNKKEISESFSEVILRMSGKKKISDFYGALSEKNVNSLDNGIKNIREKHKNLHKLRVKK
tara:strand:+ start:355 stop:582 length:228 start_codon:yes stop_codon:yes gene_type:complete